MLLKLLPWHYCYHALNNWARRLRQDNNNSQWRIWDYRVPRLLGGLPVVMVTLQVRQVGRQHALMKTCLWSLLNIFLNWLYMHFVCCFVLGVIYHARTESWGALHHFLGKDCISSSKCIHTCSVQLKIEQELRINLPVKNSRRFHIKTKKEVPDTVVAKLGNWITSTKLLRGRFSHHPRIISFSVIFSTYYQ